MDIRTAIAGTRDMNNMSSRDIAAIAGVATSTVTRFLNGDRADVSWTVGNLLLDAVDLKTDLSPLSRPSAIATARFLLADGPQADDAAFWLDRWSKIGLVDSGKVLKRRDLAFRAPRSAPRIRR